MGQKIPVQLRLDEEDVEQIDAEAESKGLSRSAHLRSIIRQHLTDSPPPPTDNGEEAE